MQRFIYLVVLMVMCLAGCGADYWPNCNDGDMLQYDAKEGRYMCVPPEPEFYIGEYYECYELGCICLSYELVDGKRPSCLNKCKWHKFRRSDVLDEHKGEIKVCRYRDTGDPTCTRKECIHECPWQSRYFYYADHDPYNKVRKEIESPKKKTTKPWYKRIFRE